MAQCDSLKNYLTNNSLKLLSTVFSVYTFSIFSYKCRKKIVPIKNNPLYFNVLPSKFNMIHISIITPWGEFKNNVQLIKTDKARVLQPITEFGRIGFSVNIRQ